MLRPRAGESECPGYRPGRIATLAEFAERWRVHVLSQRKPSTGKAAESHLRCHILPQFGSMRLDQLGMENLQAFLSKLSRRHSRKTVLNVIGTLSAMLNMAKLWGYVCEGMSSRGLALPSQGEKTRARFFAADEARRIIAEATEPYGTIFAVAAMTAVRPGELFVLKIEDLDFARRLIFIRRSVWYGKIQAPKSQSSVAALPMPERLAVRLQAYLKIWKPNAARLLFATSRGTPLGANNVVQRKLWPILDQLGIPRCGLHAFRHTHSSLLLEVGASPTVAQAQLRHSDPRITLGIYSHVLGDSHRQAVERVAEILDPSGPTAESNEKWIQ
jgi:integrase